MFYLFWDCRNLKVYGPFSVDGLTKNNKTINKIHTRQQ